MTIQLAEMNPLLVCALLYVGLPVLAFLIVKYGTYGYYMAKAKASQKKGGGADTDTER